MTAWRNLHADSRTNRRRAVAVGALGETEFPAGWYVYVGSALGSGGFGRIDRHRAVAAGDNDTRHWHIDYRSATRRRRRPGRHDRGRHRMRRRQRVDGPTAEGFDRIDAFGCSDCDCRSHLIHHEQREQLVDAVTDAHEAAGAETASATE